MDQTKVKAYFCLIGDDFPLEVVTEQLELEPTDTIKAGEPHPRNTKLKYSFTAWHFGTHYEDSVNVDEQLLPLINQLHPKQQKIIYLKDKYDLVCAMPL